MKFTISNIHNFDTLRFRFKIYSEAKNYILCYKFNTDDILLNDYLQKQYHKGLDQLCLDIIQHCTYTTGSDNNIIVVCNKKYEKLAQLITYGNLEYHGSNLLKKAFTNIRLI